MQSKLFLGLLVLGCHAPSWAQTQPSNANQVNVDRVTWQKVVNSPYQEVAASQIPAQVVFIRPASNLDDQSSVNIALNSRYLVSLQGGHYTHSLICSGSNVLSAQITGNKSNDLQASALNVQLKPQTVHYYYVNVDRESNAVTMPEMSKENA